MSQFQTLLARTGLAFLVIFLSALVFAPNVLEEDLIIAFKTERRLEDGTREPIPAEFVRDFLSDRENGLRYFFPRRTCVPEAAGNIPETHRCVLTGRFITSARVNELVQAYPEVIDDQHTGLAPHPIERFFGFLNGRDYKNLRVKLGLDLQGGMRVIFQADFEHYLARLEEKYRPELERLRTQLSLPASSEEEREETRGRIQFIQSELALTEDKKRELLGQARSVIDKRLSAQNLTENEMRVQEDSYSISLDMPGVANSTGVLSKIRDTVRVEYRLVNSEATARVNQEDANRGAMQEIYRLYARSEGRVDPRDIEDILKVVRERSGITEAEGRLFLSWRRAPDDPGSRVLPREFLVLGPPILDGDDMRNAGASVGQSAWYEVHFGLTEAGAERFCAISSESIGQRLAIVWGDRDVSYPTIQGAICGGSGQITGEFTNQEATELANVIREGALPLDLVVLSVSYVGPSLGQESIIKGVISIALGFVVVILFMIGYYRLTGFVAVVALLLNLLIMAAIMSLLEFTLTLPGFAGVILTVGMAVDANVIIFEKIKEDLRAGKSPTVSIESGFAASFWTILDANVTTLIAAVILYIPKDGPIMGFAITLFFGLVSSMFTSLFISHLLFDWFTYLVNVRKLSIGWGFERRKRAA